MAKPLNDAETNLCGQTSLGLTPEKPIAQREFAEIAEEYWDYAFNVAIRILRNEHDAEEAVQEAFISAQRAFPDFRSESKVSTWLYRIVVNACLMKFRYNKARAKHQVLAHDRIGEAPRYIDVAQDLSGDPERWAINSELQQDLKTELERLTPDLRFAIVLRDIHELSTKEAAEQLGISVPALKSRVHRGRTYLKEYLEHYRKLAPAS